MSATVLTIPFTLTQLIGSVAAFLATVALSYLLGFGQGDAHGRRSERRAAFDAGEKARQELREQAWSAGKGHS